MTNTTTTEWLRPAEVAQEWQVTVQHLASMRYEGRGPKFHKIGNAVRYRRSDLDAWLAEQARGRSGRSA